MDIFTKVIRAIAPQVIYHINAVDTVTRWQVVGCVETISELHLLPVLEAIVHRFHFRFRVYQLPCGRLLDKLRITEFTKSRANRTSDNALVEGKNEQ